MAFKHKEKPTVDVAKSVVSKAYEVPLSDRLHISYKYQMDYAHTISYEIPESRVLLLRNLMNAPDLETNQSRSYEFWRESNLLWLEMQSNLYKPKNLLKFRSQLLNATTEEDARSFDREWMEHYVAKYKSKNVIKSVPDSQHFKHFSRLLLSNRGGQLEDADWIVGYLYYIMNESHMRTFYDFYTHLKEAKRAA